MAIVQLIKGILPSRHRRQLGALRALPDGERRDQLGTLFYDECVQQASDFIRAELQKNESPFKGVHRPTFFHELMAINLWAINKTFNGKKKELMEQLHRAYCRMFRIPVQGNTAGVPPSLAEKYSIYDASWNDITGFQDVFGLRAAENIFGEGAEFRSQEASFWIVFYTDEVMKEFTQMKSHCRSMGLAIS
jgi:hypothetical protein